MSDYSKVSDALKNGADPDMLCMTCPWDRFCITPPTMTRDEIDQRMNAETEKDKKHAAEAEARGEKASMPVGSLLSVLVFAGKDTSAQVCPVLAMRLRTSDGRAVVDLIKTHMQGGAS
jgi:hypothetical protein